MDYYKTFWDLNHFWKYSLPLIKLKKLHLRRQMFITLWCYRVLEAGDDVGDAQHDAPRVAGQPRAGAELLLGHVGQEPEVLP